ncbi:MAG TPA: CPBP family intramembrane glutamic endopeptidase [Solirubrobacteraceae bacterium]
MTSVPPSFRHPGPPPVLPELPDGAPVPEAPPEGELPTVGVPVWAPFAAVLGAFAGVLVAGIFVGIAIGLGGGETADLDDSDGLTIGLTLVQDALLIAASILTVWWIAGRLTPATFGLRVPAVGPALGWTLAAYAAFWVAAIVVGVAFGNPEEQDIVTDLKAEDSFAVLAGFGVMTCVVAPIAEEFFFRGFMFRVLAERTSVALGAVVTGGVFGLVHLPSGDLVGVLVLSLFGVALCLVLWKTASLIPCIMLHAFHNSISFGFTKELPWWGFLLLIAGSVMTTLALSLVAMRAVPSAQRSRA